MSQNTTATDHWQFSLAVYGQQGVAEHCLQLQRRLGLDVNVLLLMLWAAGQWGHAPTAEQIADADSCIGQWREQIVQPLRQLRTRLKHGPPPAPDTMTNELRQDIKRLELNAERIEQDVLAQWVKQQSVAVGQQKADEPGIASAAAGQQASPDVGPDTSQSTKPAPPSSIEPGASAGIEPGVPSSIEPGASSSIEPGTSASIQPGAQSLVSTACGGHNGLGHNSAPPAPLADTAENARRLAVLEQTAVRVVAHYEAQCALSAAEAVEAVEDVEGAEAAQQTPDPWLALQHVHQIVLAAAGVLH